MKKMTTRLVCAAAILAAASGSTGATETQVTTLVDKACDFTGSLVGDVGNEDDVIYDVGQLAFSCNYTGTLKVGMTTTDGTILQVPGEPDSGVLYQIRWLVQPTGNINLLWNSALGVATFGPWIRDTGSDPHEVVSALVQVRLLDPLLVGGEYTDTVTFTVAPN